MIHHGRRKRGPYPKMSHINVDRAVGTRFIASGDSSPCTVSSHVLPVFMLVHGDESPDGIHAVPTEKTTLILLNSITASAIALKPDSIIPDAAVFRQMTRGVGKVVSLTKRSSAWYTFYNVVNKTLPYGFEDQVGEVTHFS